MLEDNGHDAPSSERHADKLLAELAAVKAELSCSERLSLVQLRAHVAAHYEVVQELIVLRASQARAERRQAEEFDRLTEEIDQLTRALAKERSEVVRLTDALGEALRRGLAASARASALACAAAARDPSA